MARRPITPGLLANLFTGHKTNFRGAFDAAVPLHERVATTVPSDGAEETYDWLGDWPAMREWVGDREINELSASTYTIKNRKFESTVKVKADHIKDDKLGIYKPKFEELGRMTKMFPDQLVFSLAAAGFDKKCYDGQPFFDDEHPIGDTGMLASNIQAGAGRPWMLLDTSRSLKPFIFQDREEFELVALDKPNDTNVVMRDEYIYGVDGRCNAGFGFWQMAFASEAALTSDNFGLARAAMGSRKSENGNPLLTQGNILLVGSNNEGPARELMTSKQIAATDNKWAGTAEILVCPWLD